MSSRALLLALASVLVAGLSAGCTEDDADVSITADDAEVEAGEAVALGKADAESYDGVYRWTTSREKWANDIGSLALTGGTYVRTRCYGYDCATLAPQTGAVEVVRASSGKIYLRFMSFTKTLDEDAGEWVEEPVLADSYEIQTTDDGVRVRKSRSRRWSYLAAVTSEDACVATDGAWDGEACACQAIEGDWSHYVSFFPGLGGCFEIFATTEDGCHETQGSYTDDDSTVIGTYCLCPVNSHETNAGCEPL